MDGSTWAPPQTMHNKNKTRHHLSNLWQSENLEDILGTVALRVAFATEGRQGRIGRGREEQRGAEGADISPQTVSSLWACGSLGLVQPPLLKANALRKGNGVETLGSENPAPEVTFAVNKMALKEEDLRNQFDINRGTTHLLCRGG